MVGAQSRFKQSLIAPFGVFAVLVALGATLDAAANGYTQLIFLSIMTNIILAVSLNLVNGFTGQFSLGHAGFMGVGAYVAGYLAMRTLGPSADLIVVPDEVSWLNFPIFAVAGGLAAAAAGWLVGLPSLRLRGDYLAIVTLGFGEIIRVVLLNTEAVGGARGMFGIPAPYFVDIGPIALSPFLMSFIFASLWVTITLFVVWRLINSTHGRGFLSVREDEIAAEAMGIDTTKMKVRAFVISSFFAGIAGALFATANRYLNPSSFGFDRSVAVIIMVVLGGMGSITGSVIAAIIVTILPEFVLRPVQQNLIDFVSGPGADLPAIVLKPLNAIAAVDLRMVIFSLLLIVFMVVRPKGIFGKAEITDLIVGAKRGTRPARS